MAAARELLARLPDELGGEARQLVVAQPEGDEDDFAAVQYGEHTSLTVTDGTFAGGPGVPAEMAGAQAKLAALFGVVYACDMDTYAGTIEPQADYPVPGYAQVDAGTPAWFACRIAGAEGAEDLSAQAVGWTSSDRVAWLAVGPDDAAVRALVTAMREANG